MYLETNTVCQRSRSPVANLIISAQGTHAHPHRRETFRVPVLQLQGAVLGHPVPAQAEGPPAAMGAEGEAREESAGMHAGSYSMHFTSVSLIQGINPSNVTYCSNPSLPVHYPWVLLPCFPLLCWPFF